MASSLFFPLYTEAKHKSQFNTNIAILVEVKNKTLVILFYFLRLSPSNAKEIKTWELRITEEMILTHGLLKLGSANTMVGFWIASQKLCAVGQ
jgi:hypothetical protein